MSTPEPEAQPWYQSSQIRVALTVVVIPLFFRIAQHTKLGQWMAAYLGINVLTMRAEDAVDWLMLAVSAVGGVFWVHKRVQAGKDPRSCAPEIIPPKIVQRLTGNVRPVVDEYAEIAKSPEPIQTKDVPFIDPEKAREEINDLAEMIRKDEELRKRLHK